MKGFVFLHLDTPDQINKLVGELYCNYFHDYYKLTVAIARYFNVFGLAHASPLRTGRR
jgi:nucleoside-diphosphate-sugar epimerase